jgi:hypothetical protein
MSHQKRVSFVVPITSGQFAPEILYLNPESLVNALMDTVSEMTAFVEALTATATLEVDILKPGGLPQNAADWYLAIKVWNTAGIQALFQLARICGVRVRAKSGGTAGTTILALYWW